MNSIDESSRWLTLRNRISGCIRALLQRVAKFRLPDLLLFVPKCVWKIVVALHPIVKIIEPWGILVAAVALFFTAIGFWIDFSERIEDRQVRAWQLVTTPAPGNSGKVEALEYLNSEDGVICSEWLRGKLRWFHRNNKDTACLLLLKARTVLFGVDLSRPELKTLDACLERKAGVFLQNIDLRRGLLQGADFSSASLFKADFRNAELNGANFSCAHLNHARLNDAVLVNANLTYSILKNAELTGVRLRGADLSNADLSQSRGLEESELHKACGNQRTKLPRLRGKQLRIPLCTQPKGVFGR